MPRPTKAPSRERTSTSAPAGSRRSGGRTILPKIHGCAELRRVRSRTTGSSGMGLSAFLDRERKDCAGAFHPLQVTNGGVLFEYPKFKLHGRAKNQPSEEL